MSMNPRAIARVPLRWLMTNNPFYALSAAFVFSGLRLSCGTDERSYAGLALMAGLAAYTILLACTALALVRRAKAWDDVRTVLLLVVLMFMALSVSCDDRLAANADRGPLFYVAGLVFAILLIEGLFRGLPLHLPMGFRVPFWLFLALFFLYPIGVGRLACRPESSALHAALLGFPLVASLITLTLLPAARRGASYVQAKGSPWRWPMYPWSLFVFLGVGVLARSQYLCVSFHFIEGRSQGFGPYFLAPFVLTVGAVLYEIGRAANHRPTVRLALCVPLLAVGTCLFGHRDDAVYRLFLAEFQRAFAASPAYVMTVVACAFYLVTSLRGERLARTGLMLALVAFVFVGPTTLDWMNIAPPRGAPVAIAGLMPLAIGARRRDLWTCFVGLVEVTVGLAIRGWEFDPFAWTTAAHVLVGGMLLLGLLGKDEFARTLRMRGAWGLGGLGLLATVASASGMIGPSDFWVTLEPPVLAVIGILYAKWTRERPSAVAAGVTVSGWGVRHIWTAYAKVRTIASGMDAIVLGLVFFFVAATISFGKAGVLKEWLEKAHRGLVRKPGVEDLSGPPFG